MAGTSYVPDGANVRMHNGAIEPFVQIQGQAGWYLGGNPRVFYQDTTLGPDFFRLPDEPVSLVVFGDLTIADGVTDAPGRAVSGAR